MTNKYMYFVANWKMFGDFKSLKLVNKVISFSKKFKSSKFKIIYLPPTTLICPMAQMVKNTKIKVGAQNCHHQDNYGAETGSINAKMVKGVGAKYVILGHSENRENGESDKLINQKIKTALKNKLKVIFCIGEKIKDKRNKKTKSVLSKQIKLGLKGVKLDNNIIIAYEPVWAIGSGMIPKSNDLLNAIDFIKSRFKQNLKILYGGSVNDKNINELKTIHNIDGFLVGGASQNSKKFIDIIKKTYN
ncbi:triose-phosphate isomerase [Candidatus Pelagibacter sp.]|uniref:triose-phosphate isomerase n=1 Tax=Candidatus Pelagibacter sp. TaxID=2024849 RepID=UPI003F82916D